MSSPNIILIILDTLRGDKINTHYKKIPLSPFINSILNSSIYCKKAVSVSPWTLPVHLSLFTGLYPTQIKLISKKVNVINKNTPVLTEFLKKNGFNTFCYTENPWISEVFGLTRGFNFVYKNFCLYNKVRHTINNKKTNRLYRYIKILNNLETIFKIKAKLRYLDVIFKHLKYRLIHFLRSIFWKNILINIYLNKNDSIFHINNFLEVIKQKTEDESIKPHFIFFNIMATHDPYMPLKETFKLFNIKNKDFNYLKSFYLNKNKTRFNINLKEKHLSKKKLKILEKLYNACVYSSDILVKLIFNTLKDLSILENAYIIITSDHGEHLGNRSDHYLWEHRTHRSVYKPLIQVPLIIYNNSFHKKIVENPIRLIDLFHTICDITSNENPKSRYFEAKKSLFYQIKNNSTPEYIYGEYIKDRKAIFKLINNSFKDLKKDLLLEIFNDIIFVMTKNDKLIKYSKTKSENTYQLENDPSKNNKKELSNRNKKELVDFLENFYTSLQNIDEIIYDITKREKYILKRAINKLDINNF